MTCHLDFLLPKVKTAVGAVPGQRLEAWITGSQQIVCLDYWLAFCCLCENSTMLIFHADVNILFVLFRPLATKPCKFSRVRPRSQSIPHQI